MPRRSKGARLYFRTGKGSRAGVWIIRDGAVSRRTGFASHQLGEAEEALRRYIAEKHSPIRTERHPAQIRIADVLHIYVEDVAPKHARPHETAARLARLDRFWGDKRLSDVTGRACRAYVEFVGRPQAARRDLEDFRAAIIHHRREGFCSEIVEVVLPPKAAPRERWLTRSEAARLLLGALGFRLVPCSRLADRTPSWAVWDRRIDRCRLHVARFILVGLYTGTRAGAICGAALQPAIGRGYVDLENGVFYRRAPGSKETRKRQPPIRLPERLLAHLRRWNRKQLATAAVVQINHPPRPDGTPRSPHVVSRVSKGFRGAATDAGLVGVTPHTLRHTAATWAMQGGADLWEAAGYLGMTVQMLEERYGHHRPEHGAGVARALRARR